MCKVLYLNLGNFGSTGKIVLDISKAAEEKGFDIIKCFPEVGVNSPPDKNSYIISSNIVRKINNYLGFLTGYEGCWAWRTTRRLIRFIDTEKPDIIHLHNIHSSFINHSLLFNYLKTTKSRIIWTLHDCWSMTGRCPHFQIAKCEKWKTGCYKCNYPHLSYPQSLFDHSNKQWQKKRRLFSSLTNMVLVTPSVWLMEIVKQSYLKGFQLRVVYNGVDTSVFCPTPSSFRRNYSISDDCSIVLGVAFGWGERKGLDVFIELAKRLNPSLFRIVLVGTNDSVDKTLPNQIISIHRTANQKELAEVYTAATVFVNPTREEVLGLVNLEALACGTPVVTFKTGGSPECIDYSTGSIVAKNDVDMMEKEIIRICRDRPYSTDSCIERARQFDSSVMAAKYINLYNECLST